MNYVYQIGKYEVAASQYTTFLNAVAATDTYGVYDESMWGDADYGCRIQRSGSPGSYTYNALVPFRPVNYVSWGDAARFTNWLHNGQPTGAQGAGTTETGAYTLNGATSDSALMAVTRNADAKYWIPTENEWYKAAYHKNDGVTGNYWDYPTSSDSINTSMANYGYVQRGPTQVNSYENFPSPYGTQQQGGNVSEWNDAAVTGSSRGYRGGGFVWDSSFLAASGRQSDVPTYGTYDLGFRVAGSAAVPEPGSITLMSCGALFGLWRWRRRKQHRS